jgi:SAM-dependent methyltransferase
VIGSTLIPESIETPASDPYAVLVRYYDAETADMRDDLAAYSALARRFGGPLLDVGCGTGRVAFALAGQGHALVGFDTSTPMLDRARARAERERVAETDIRWLQADVTALALDDRFGLAVWAYNGFMHLVEQPRQIAALQHVAAHLKPGGALAIDVPNPIEMFRVEDTPGLVLERIFTDPETGQPVMQHSLARVDRAAQIMSVTWVYDRIDPEGLVYRQLAPLRLRYTMAAEMELLLARAGFDAIHLYGDYDFTPYAEDSPRLFALAERGRAA